MIYLDHAAATPVCPQALAAMQPYFSELFFNPSAPYLLAKKVRADYEAAKQQIAHCIGAKGPDLVITSGATEAINLAFTAACSGKVLFLCTEHSAVITVAKSRQAQAIKVKNNSLIDLADLRSKLDDSVSLVSVALVNNELGTIQPLSSIAQIIQAERSRRLASGNQTPLYLHTDASQALSLLDVSTARLGVDLLTINAAKLGGPKGVGALYTKRGVNLQPIMLGGGQERGLRSGTENVAAVIGFAAAVKVAKQQLATKQRQYQSLRQSFLDGITTKIAQLSILADADHSKYDHPFIVPLKQQLASFINLVFPGLDAERLIYKLEAQDVFVSTGAACAANKGQKSHVLAAIGLSDVEIAGSLRISFGPTNTEKQAIQAAQFIVAAAQAEYARLLR